jgi:hypothetical protein
MAESESLNLDRARRWQPVLQAAGDGASADDLAVLARRCLYVELYRSYRDEWLGLAGRCVNLGFPWAVPVARRKAGVA